MKAACKLMTPHMQAVPKSLALKYTTAQIYIPEPICKEIFSSYFLLKWEGAFLRDSIHNGKIKKDGKNWNVIYLGVFPSEFSSHPRRYFKVSFRELDQEKYLDTLRYVVISKY